MSGTKTPELTANSILSYQTDLDELRASAGAALPHYYEVAKRLKSATFVRYCVICGTRFEAARPDFLTCSDECWQEYDSSSQWWARDMLSAHVPKALEILAESPIDEHVYFVRGTVTGRVKIGYSRDAQGRFGDLQTASPEQLELLCVIHGDRTLESQLHRRFSGCRIHGEWFEPTEALLELIEELRQGCEFDESVDERA